MGTKKKIMIVEDEFITAMCMRDDLIQQGYEVSELVSSGEEAIIQAEVERPDVIIMDIHLLGELNGMEAGEQIYSRFGIPIVYVTGYSDEKIFANLDKTKPIACIIKPVSSDSLDKIIKSFLQSK